MSSSVSVYENETGADIGGEAARSREGSRTIASESAIGRVPGCASKTDTPEAAAIFPQCASAFKYRVLEIRFRARSDVLSNRCDEQGSIDARNSSTSSVWPLVRRYVIDVNRQQQWVSAAFRILAAFDRTPYAHPAARSFIYTAEIARSECDKETRTNSNTKCGISIRV